MMVPYRFDALNRKALYNANQDADFHHIAYSTRLMVGLATGEPTLNAV